MGTIKVRRIDLVLSLTIFRGGKGGDLTPGFPKKPEQQGFCRRPSPAKCPKAFFWTGWTEWAKPRECAARCIFWMPLPMLPGTPPYTQEHIDAGLFGVTHTPLYNRCLPQEDLLGKSQPLQRFSLRPLPAPVSHSEIFSFTSLEVITTTPRGEFSGDGAQCPFKLWFQSECRRFSPKINPAALLYLFLNKS
jgi:hypothetical protein